MQRTLNLVLMRHGQAEFHHSEGDRERSLTERGLSQVKATGTQLHAGGFLPSAIFVSGASRTRQTANQLKTIWPNLPHRIMDRLYLAPAHTTLQLLGQESLEEHDSLLLIGHNPGFSELSTALSGVRIGLDTAAAAWLELEAASWEEALQMTGVWELKASLHPGL